MVEEEASASGGADLPPRAVGAPASAAETTASALKHGRGFLEEAVDHSLCEMEEMAEEFQGIWRNLEETTPAWRLALQENGWIKLKPGTSEIDWDGEWSAMHRRASLQVDKVREALTKLKEESTKPGYQPWDIPYNLKPRQSPRFVPSQGLLSARQMDKMAAARRQELLEALPYRPSSKPTPKKLEWDNDEAWSREAPGQSYSPCPPQNGLWKLLQTVNFDPRTEELFDQSWKEDRRPVGEDVSPSKRLQVLHGHNQVEAMVGPKETLDLDPTPRDWSHVREQMMRHKATVMEYMAFPSQWLSTLVTQEQLIQIQKDRLAHDSSMSSCTPEPKSEPTESNLPDLGSLSSRDLQPPQQEPQAQETCIPCGGLTSRASTPSSGISTGEWPELPSPEQPGVLSLVKPTEVPSSQSCQQNQAWGSHQKMTPMYNPPRRRNMRTTQN